MLTWWQGPVTLAAFGLGEGVIADTSYRTIKTVHAGNGYPMDLHEFELTPDGDALFTVYSPVLVHLARHARGHAARRCSTRSSRRSTSQTGLVVWEWHALGHIPLAESYATPANSASYDAFHINSIQALAGGRVLVSARDTSAVYEVDRASGRDPAGPSAARRAASGSGRARASGSSTTRGCCPDGRVSLFDDEAGPAAEGARPRAG